ncbi:hypothetical protein [Paenibacillus larvae]|nr:hypothetical protein [Paenibacillus larvae]MCY7522392.1 hypothetical protein [Paenibacillus larvae]MCY9501878.1 hypothetical protein [Paenibacillus larvae]MCY9678958.1 hypothetical protein [Paenibacillus larvae]MCY9747096.1 hypothetical protein [Paenibacillus larvae]MCY9752575.1 hypothetical protein [Paenibacillus larvae]
MFLFGMFILALLTFI